jgi:pectate lyase
MEKRVRPWHGLLGWAWLFPVVLLASGCGESSDPSGSAGGDAGGSGGASGSGGAIAGTGGGGGGSGGGSAGLGSTGGGAGSAPTGDAPIGWASVNALGQDGTYGGRDGDTVEVTSIQQFVTAAAGPAPRLIRVRGHLVGDVGVGSNKTVEGVDGAVLEGSMSIDSVQNVIVRNLTVKGKNCTDNAMCSDGDDAIGVRGSHHIWFDHLDVSDGSDGNLDITTGSDYVTVSWSKFWYSGTARDHRFSNLIGSDDNIDTDEGKLKVTWHHNWWADNADQRMPRSRYGLIHVFNNLYTPSNNSYCANAGFHATLLVENNVFRGINSPHTVSEDGDLLARGNDYDNVTGTQDETGTGFEPPYTYTADATSELTARIQQEAGPR